jgi:hypothetical protein
MQGKNKREGSRRSRREEGGKEKKNKKVLLLPDGDSANGRQQQQQQQNRREAVVGQDAVQTRGALSRNDLVVHSRGLLLNPRFTGVDAQLIPGSLVVEAFAYDITNASLSPFDPCVDFGSVAGHMVPFEQLRSDKLFVHSILATGYALDDFTGKSPSPTQQTLQHLHNALKLLRGRLQSPMAYREEAVIHAVLNLAQLAGGFSHWAATIVHLQGLQRIVRLNGGSAFLARWPKLLFKLGR